MMEDLVEMLEKPMVDLLDFVDAAETELCLLDRGRTLFGHSMDSVFIGNGTRCTKQRCKTSINSEQMPLSLMLPSFMPSMYRLIGSLSFRFKTAHSFSSQRTYFAANSCMIRMC